MSLGADLLRRLYAEPPDRFTAARDAAVAEARARGDVAGAKETAALRKPVIAAWLVNLLAIRRPDLLADLAALAGEMRAAQRELRGADLRELSGQRRRLVASLVAEARTLAGAAGVSTAKLPLTEVEDTLTAALSDEEIAASVRSGRLLRPVSYAGFGEVPRPRLRLVAAPDAESPEVDDPGDEGAGAGRDGAGRARPAAGPVSATGRADGGVRGRRGGSGPRTPGGSGDPAVRPASAPGVDAEDEPAGRTVIAGRSSARKAEAARKAEDAARRALERAERAALRDRERAEADLATAEGAERAAVAAVADLSERIAALQAERNEADHEVSRRKLARKTAERAASAARRRHGDAAAALEASGATPDRGAAEPFVEPAAPFADGGRRKGAARRGRTDRGGPAKAESGA
ncbi:hypothetical protein JCM9533A_77600 [Catenuloplanes niger JCM 9533]|uniref:Uncharacterized protein n=1 Tax=Catenuloplanes niger TaxID=587534 RepID=A0AAE3ZU96_9ACTN|nr:hypothetical protein [Catenuloplanes niger]MDR7324293.1 hypothetical protein [Catenuloplanes niger]